MDFFEYATVALQFVNSETLYVPLIVGGLCFLVVFIFQSIGLYTIAKREGYKNKWMAFVPFFNTYYIGVCGQKNRAFGKVDTRYLALAAAILEGLLFVGYIVYYAAVFKLSAANCIYQPDAYSEIQLVNITPELYWAVWCFECLYDYILMWFDLVFLALQVFVLSAFFQTYSARRYFLFTITSVLFPVQGIIIFMLRNNTGMNYREFMRREQERQYRIYQQYARQNYENDPYNQNPYSRGGYDPASEPHDSPDDPFSDLGNGGGSDDNSDPFDL